MARKKNGSRPALAHAGFRPGEQEIFHYWDGERMVAADPLRIHRELHQFPDLHLGLDLKLIQTESDEAARDAAKSLTRIVEAVRQVFRLKSPTEENGTIKGYTDAACLELLTAFGVFLVDLKKKYNPSPMSAPPSEEPSSADPSATPNLSDSGFTVTEPPASRVSPSPSELSLP